MARYPEMQWHLGPIARPLLGDIAQRHPVKVRRLAPLAQIFAGGAEYELVWNPNDDRVDALRRIADEAFRSLEAKTDGRTAYALVPKLNDVIAKAIAQRDAAVAGRGIAA